MVSVTLPPALICGVTLKITPVSRNEIVWEKRVVPFCWAALAAEVVGIGTSAGICAIAGVLLLTRTDGADNVRTRDRFSEAFRKVTSSRERPMNMKVLAATTPAWTLAVVGIGGFCKVPRFCKIADKPSDSE